MVKGWSTFSNHFAGYEAHYVLIGGTATELAMTDAGIPFRGTKDLDIVLVVGALTAEFATHFWAFISAGGYTIQASKDGKQPKRYRFVNATVDDYPYMIELFSRKPDGLALPRDARITPIPNEVSDLSGILLDDDYYRFVLDGRKYTMDGVPLVGHDRLIPLKATAWRNLTRDRDAGNPVKVADILKHAQDVRDLAALLTEGVTIAVPARVYDDLEEFLEQAHRDMTRGSTEGAVATAVTRIRAAFIQSSASTA